MFFQIKFVLHIFAKQVSNLFVVNFQVRSMDQILDPDGHLNSLKDVIESSETQPRTKTIATTICT